MESSDVYINDSKSLPTANHSRGLPVPNAHPDEIPLQEEVYETVGESELESRKKHESGKFLRS